jgi:hypothetical protein
MLLIAVTKADILFLTWQYLIAPDDKTISTHLLSSSHLSLLRRFLWRLNCLFLGHTNVKPICEKVNFTTFSSFFTQDLFRRWKILSRINKCMNVAFLQIIIKCIIIYLLSLTHVTNFWHILNRRTIFFRDNPLSFPEIYLVRRVCRGR